LEAVVPKAIEALTPLLAAAEGGSAGGGSFLVTPSLGLMIWTLIAFGVTFWVLKKFAYPKIEEALDKRAALISESLDSAERQRVEADKLLADYRQRLAEAREQADGERQKFIAEFDEAEREANAAMQKEVGECEKKIKEM